MIDPIQPESNDLVWRLRAIERQIEELARANRGAFSSVGARIQFKTGELVTGSNEGELYSWPYTLDGNFETAGWTVTRCSADKMVLVIEGDASSLTSSGTGIAVDLRVVASPYAFSTGATTLGTITHTTAGPISIAASFDIEALLATGYRSGMRVQLDITARSTGGGAMTGGDLELRPPQILFLPRDVPINHYSLAPVTLTF